MNTARIFRPTMTAGIVYAREVGAAVPLQSIGGIEELTLGIDANKINQANTSSSGGGNRAVVERITAVTLTAKLQDLNPVNLARSLRAASTAVIGATVVDEVHSARKGGLVRLAHLNPSAVTIKDNLDVTIAPAGNYEVRPEGIFFLDTAPALVTEPMNIKVSYAHSGYDLLEVLTQASPILEMSFAGVNEALQDAPCVVDLFRVQLSATKGLNLISAGAFSTLDVEGEVLLDPTKTGTGISKYMRKQLLTPA